MAREMYSRLNRVIILGDWKFNEIEIQDNALFNQYIQSTQYPANLWSSNFAYLWAISQSDSHRVLWRIVEDLLGVFIHTANDALYLHCLPLGPGDADKIADVTFKCLSYCDAWNTRSQSPEQKKRAQVKLLNEQQLAFLKNSSRFKRLFTLITWQGIERHYSITALEQLKGKEFADLRNRLSKFKREHPDAAICKYKDSNYDEVMALGEQWKKTAGQKYSHVFDRVYYRELVKHCEELKQQILLVRIDSRIVGMISGSVLPTGQAWGSVIKYQEGIAGLSETLTVEFSRYLHRLNPAIQYLNVGSDLSSKGLRQYKLKFNPVLNLKRYQLLLKPQDSENAENHIINKSHLPDASSRQQ